MKKELFESIVNCNESKDNQKHMKETIDTYAIHNKIVDAFDDLYETAGSPKAFATIVTDALSNSMVSDEEIKALADELHDYITANC